MLVEKICGGRVDDVRAFTAANMLSLFGAKLTPNRQKCCLLCWRALQSAIYSPLEAAPSDPSPGGNCGGS
jgi:nitrogen fixation NifU-like protein